MLYHNRYVASKVVETDTIAAVRLRIHRVRGGMVVKVIDNDQCLGGVSLFTRCEFLT